jgi:DNA segregation ATPase FtsK/SpoIIIE-like protein
MTLYQKAKAIARRTGRVSIALVERELRCGYGDAARLVAKLVRLGVVSTDHEVVK